MNYNIIMKTADGTHMYEGYRMHLWKVQCKECEFHEISTDWESIKEKVTIHNEFHRIEVSVIFQSNLL
jgi:hypothetical protein